MCKPKNTNAQFVDFSPRCVHFFELDLSPYMGPYKMSFIGTKAKTAWGPPTFCARPGHWETFYSLAWPHAERNFPQSQRPKAERKVRRQMR